MKKNFTVALAGNPNCGKTCIFNALTGARQHVGNYPGVTVESKSGHFILNGIGNYPDRPAGGRIRCPPVRRRRMSRFKS